MKRDVQVGVILGVIILAIIGVFLSTRTAVKEPTIPIPDAEEDTQVGALDINELPQAPPNTSQDTFKEMTATIQNTEQKVAPVINTAKILEQPAEQEDNVIEGVWKKAKDEVINVSSRVSETSDQEIWKDISSESVKKSTSKFQVHKVRSNDDLHKIAQKYYGDVSKWLLIFNANQDKIKDRNSLRIGTELIIPEEQPSSQKTKTETTTPALSQVTKVEDAVQTGKKHIVQQGDSLYKLAQKYYNDGSKWNKILEANKIILKNRNALKVRQELVIPDL
ncbi:MAG TPA: LysM peptidoglycan-binding domain-containing protein [Candidatus Wunengus californicus]|uniref:LysM peptidoglycan-binding domain-containing protein n=1 Tax=Candidatus Wunengus californicus TaxID=3367619 RepID=UPI0040283270